MVEGRDHTSGGSLIMTGPPGSRGSDIELSGATIDDQEFIAHARADIPRLLTEIHRLRSREQVARIIQIALLGEVAPALRGVAFWEGERDIRIVFYYDGAVSERDRESASRVVTELIAALPEYFNVSEEVVRLDAPARLPTPGAWAYHRRES
jgi:hypothetical protein